MKDIDIKQLMESFEDAVNYYENNKKEPIEYWLARDLQDLFDYTEWRNFYSVIKKAAQACANAGGNVDDHFLSVKTEIKAGITTKQIDDFMLTRYACYLIAQNGDPSKEPVAFAQTYFSVQTRKFEVIQQQVKETKRLEARAQLTEREKKLSDLIHYRDVPDGGFARIRSKGDQVLFWRPTYARDETPLKRP